MHYPIIDLHCDLTSYLAKIEGATIHDTEGIGCAWPLLRKGNVFAQVTAFYSSTSPGSTDFAAQQVEVFNSLPEDHFLRVKNLDDLRTLKAENKRVGAIAAIENASGLCEEDEPLQNGFDRLDKIRKEVGRMLYIGITHHPENRFGGGNYSGNVGLKDDGKALLEYLHGTKIAVDFSHASDALVEGVLDYIDAKSLDVPVMASHSIFREVFDHVRNLPDELAKEIIRRGGLLGANFLRDYVNEEVPDALYNHIEYGFGLGGEKAMAFGGDYFYTKSIPDQSRMPFYFPPYDQADCYPHIQDQLRARGMSEERIEAMANGNVMRFLERIW